MTWAFLVDSIIFTKAAVAGQTSLGGSESAGLGLARALQRRGGDVHVFATRLDPDAAGPDAAGVTWHALADFPAMNRFIEWDVVVALRSWPMFAQAPVYARLRILWNQDLLVPGPMQQGVMSVAWALDRIAYVSAYHRAQWEDAQPELAPLGWVTRNGYDPADCPVGTATKDPHRILHTSRPERGLGPLLQMWPALKAQRPKATLQLCRYSSMYDTGPGSWTDVCASWDAQVARVNAAVGGITYLGELTKPQLYQAISQAAVVWYPGVATFAETSCIAATEALANGTPFVGSLRGALPETAPPSYDAGLLIPGDAERDPAYHEASIAAVIGLLDGCQRNSVAYRGLQRAGRRQVATYPHDVIAGEWEAQVETWFAERYASHTVGVLRQLLHEDDHVAARIVARDIVDTYQQAHGVPNHPGYPFLNVGPVVPSSYVEAGAAAAFCRYVIAGKDHDAEHYGNAAVYDPLLEIKSPRFAAVIPRFTDCTRVLDVACGNGSFAIALALAVPTVHVYGFDYAEANILRAADAAVRAGVGDRCHFSQCTVYDFDAQTMHAEWLALAHDGWRTDTSWQSNQPTAPYDGLFVGEFIEHVAACTLLIDALETVLAEGSPVVYTCPHGACAELVPRGVPLRRGHVHRFHHDDIKAVWGQKPGLRADYLEAGVTLRGAPIGNWLISYQTQAGKLAQPRPLAARIARTRPLQKLSVGLIVKDAESDLARCLASIEKQADEIVVGDTGSTDETKAIAARYGAKVIDLPSVMVQPDGFAGARNQVLAQCTGDWFLWIDADEQLLNGQGLRRYLDGVVFHGYVIRQTHLYIDAPPTWDIPVRVFRKTANVQFYGAIHEQPQAGDCNGDIYPTLDISDLRLAHWGYLTDAIREEKRVSRNLPLLIRDQQRFPDRLLGQVLCLREAVLQADVSRAQAGGELTDRARQGYAYTLDTFIRHFDDPAHKYHKLARPWYEVALEHLGIGWQQEIAIAGRAGGLGASHAAPERIWVRDADEFLRVMRFKTERLADGMRPAVFKTAPFTLPVRATRPTAVSRRVSLPVTSFEHLARAEAMTS